MNEYVTKRFAVGDIVRNTHTQEDGKIDAVQVEEDSTVTYLVHTPFDKFGWEMGTSAVDVPWPEAILVPSPNEALYGTKAK